MSFCEDEGEAYVVCWKCKGMCYTPDPKDRYARDWCSECKGTGKHVIKDSK